MSYPLTTPNISDGAANHVYEAVDFGSNIIIRRESAAPANLQANLTVSHQEVGEGQSARIRSRVQMDREVEDALGNRGVVKAYTVIDWPHRVATTAQAKATFTELLSFHAIAGYVDKMLNREV